MNLRLTGVQHVRQVERNDTNLFVSFVDHEAMRVSHDDYTVDDGKEREIKDARVIICDIHFSMAKCGGTFHWVSPCLLFAPAFSSW